MSRLLKADIKGINVISKSSTREEVQFALKNLNVRKSYGWDVTALPKLFKGVAEGIAPSLTRLYNNCIRLRRVAIRMEERRMDPCIQKGRQTRQIELSLNYFTYMCGQDF